MIMVNIYFYHFDLIIVNIKSAYYCIISYKENIYNIKMCGIVGVITKNDDLFMLLMHGLKQLQNRGYDSAGISTIFENNFQLSKYASNYENALVLLERNKQIHENSNIGIAHTRWATHGGKTDANSHPHISSDSKFSLVHNGIIENYKELKNMLIEQKYSFKSETDSEVIVNLIAYNYKSSNNVIESITKTISMLHGTWGFAILCSDKPDEIYCTTNGSPLLIGKTDNYAMIVSEQSAFSDSITNYIVLKNMDICVINNKLFIETRHFYNKLKQKTFENISNTLEPYTHWTLKEIYEQKESIKLCESIAHEGALKIKEISYIHCEGALKIKEISYIHCEGYSTSSLKHGPFALLSDNFPVVLIAPDDEHYVKNENAYNEIKSRNANVIWITDKDIKNSIKIPSNKTYNSLLSVIPLQMLAYKLSINKGINPDMPKNLAKVVTVE